MAQKKEQPKKEVAVIANEEVKLKNFSSVDEMMKWADTIIEGGLLPDSISEPEQVITIVQHGQELGLTPHIALNNLHVIAGRPVVSSSMLGALLKKRNVEWIIEQDFETYTGPDGVEDKKTTYKFYWKSKVVDKVMEATHSITWRQMEVAGYTTKHNWGKYPKEMMRARCLASAVRALFPEVLMGMYSDLEINDVAKDLGVQELDVTVDTEGEIILTQPSK